MSSGHEKLTVDATVRTLQDVPTASNYAAGKCETGSIRFRTDGTDPATATGVLIKADENFRIYGNDILNQIKFVEATSTDAVINLSYGIDNSGKHCVEVG